MKLFVCVVDDECGILPRFLRHYAARGITQFFVACPRGLKSNVERHQRDYHVVVDTGQDVVESIPGGVSAVTAMRTRHQHPGEWVMVVDLDEFVEFDPPLEAIIQKLDAEGVNVARGLMLDRFARSGAMEGFADGEALDAAFPVKARFNQTVLRGNEYKAVFVKGLLESANAHHEFHGERVGSRIFEISHYRFHGRSLDRLRAGYRRVRDANVSWAEQYGNILRHYDEHGRFAWEAFGGWRDDLVGTDVGFEGAVLRVRHRDNTADRAVLAQVFTRRDYDMPGCYLNEVASYHQRIVQAGKAALIVDAGAHIGASALWFGHKWSPCRIVCVEPDRDNFEVLASNVNRASLDVQLYQAGIDHVDGSAVLTDPGGGEWAYRTSRQGEGTRVRMVSMNTIFSHNPGWAPFILKVDIEGYERALFLENTSEIARFPVVVIELHDWMLPGQGTSTPFMRWHARNRREIVLVGENAISVDWERLTSHDIAAIGDA